MIGIKRGMAIIALVAGVPLAAAPAAAHDNDCGRQCLKDLADSYVAALVAHDPGQTPLADDVTMVQNLDPIDPGEGLWQTAAQAPTSFKIYIPDPVSGQIGFMGLMAEEDGPALLGLRLKVRSGEITEAEHLIARDLADGQIANLQVPRPAFTTAVPEYLRDTRSRMIEIGASYYDALDDNDGSLTPFADDCVRFENGRQSTGNPPPENPEEAPAFAIAGSMGCADQLDTQIMSYIDSIENRRVEIADPETGLVFGISHFFHDMAEDRNEVVGIEGVDSVEMDFDPFDLPAIHIYKVYGGQMHEIEAMGTTLPYQSPKVFTGN